MPIEVKTAEDIDVTVRNNPYESYVQTRHIDLGGYNWEPIHAFYGTYDGQGYSINNLYIAQPPTQHWRYYSLFRTVSGATMKNMRMLNVNIQLPFDGDQGGSWSGGVAGQTMHNSLFQCCYVTGVINSSISGGICGRAYGGTFLKCASKVDLTGYAYRFPPGTTTRHNGSGIVYWDESDHALLIKDCYGRVTFDGGNYYEDIMDGWYVGNCIGGRLRYTTIENCYGTGSNSIHDPWLSSFVTINNCYFDADLVPAADGSGEPRTTAQMTHPESFGNTYVGWDFSNVWASDAGYTINNGYPYLRCPAVPLWNIWVNKSGAWHRVTDIWTYKGGVWLPVSSVDVRKSGEWKII